MKLELIEASEGCVGWMQDKLHDTSERSKLSYPVGAGLGCGWRGCAPLELQVIPKLAIALRQCLLSLPAQMKVVKNSWLSAVIQAQQSMIDKTYTSFKGQQQSCSTEYRSSNATLYLLMISTSADWTSYYDGKNWSTSNCEFCDSRCWIYSDVVHLHGAVWWHW
jgi:hypothetical protein